MNLYRLLLHFYPNSFQMEYGSEMSGIFALELGRCSGPAARCALWVATMVEILTNAAVLHWEIARRDLYHSTRSLRRSPAFAITAATG